MLIITSYKNPDLDGTACTIAYAEFLNKLHNEERAIPVISGTPHIEARFVLEKFSVSSPRDIEENDVDKKIIIVDTSDNLSISQYINPDNVIEVIDHRKEYLQDAFPNAKFQVELVGAAATLIAEKYFQENINISPESAALLYLAIVSNTMNFKAKVTTIRDREMAKWLQTKCEIPGNFIHNMFATKSKLDKPLKEIFLGDFKKQIFDKASYGIIQLEIIDVDKFVKERRQEVEDVLEEIKKEKQLDFIFLTCIDLEKGFNVFMTFEKETQEFFENILSVSFLDNVARREGIVLRKEIWSLVKKAL